MKTVLVAVDVVDVAPGFDPEFTNEKITVSIPFSDDLGRVVLLSTVLELLDESLTVVAKRRYHEDVRLSDLFRKALLT